MVRSQAYPLIDKEFTEIRIRCFDEPVLVGIRRVSNSAFDVRTIPVMNPANGKPMAFA